MLYEVITDAAVAFLVDHLSTQLHLILISREVPPLPLARWRMQQRLSEIGLESLRFSAVESARFLTDTIGVALPENLLRTLERKTEGWIAGLQMAALSLQHSADDASRNNFV